jgi:predicted RNA-binding Zn-ribbon protein involved in translation (DUF1610 family)
MLCVGDKVKIVNISKWPLNDCFSALNVEGFVLEVYKEDERIGRTEIIYKVGDKENYWLCVDANLELIRSTTQSATNNCPRCGKETFNKISECTNTTVRKCHCGWCD